MRSCSACDGVLYHLENHDSTHGSQYEDHYKIDSKLGNWSDIKSFSKKSDIMADIVINHSSARGLWFKNFLRAKRPGKDYFLTVDSKFNTSKVVRPRDHKPVSYTHLTLPTKA